MAKVLKPFTTTLRKFAEGDEVSETDDLSPHAHADLADRGFIDAPRPPQATRPRKARTPDAEAAADAG